jgi:bacteriochlorophyllide a dehydrogenase
MMSEALADRGTELRKMRRAPAYAVLLQRPREIQVSALELDEPGPADVVVQTEWSAISTGTERLLYEGRMPEFPGMGYPLVPGYEAVGRVREVGPQAAAESGGVAPAIGQRVFVGGARCFGKVRGLFGAASQRLVVPASRALTIPEQLGEQAVLIALAATAHHALRLPGVGRPELIVGHGILGRLLARIAIALDPAAPPPAVWERNALRSGGAAGYAVLDAEQDPRRDYRTIVDASGDSGLLDALIGRLAAGGEVVLAGFYSQPLQFAFAPAFMREARLRVAAEWKPGDLLAVLSLLASGGLSLDGLITHRRPASEAPEAYRIAFEDPSCLKMVLDWRSLA